MAHRTKESECSSWPTPLASDGAQGAIISPDDTYYTTSTGMPREVNRNGTDGSVGLGRLVQMWRTPQAHNGQQGPKSKELYEKCLVTGQSMITLVDQVKNEGKNWPTPRANKVGGSTSEGYGLCLDEAVNGGRKAQNWPTPCVADIFTANLKSTQQKPGSMHSVNLSQCVNWPTPAARDWKDSGDLQKLADNTHQMTLPKMIARLAVANKERKNDDTTYQGNTDKILFVLWREVGTKKVQRTFGRFGSVQQKNVLRHDLHGGIPQKRTSLQVCNRQAAYKGKKRMLRDVRGNGEFTNAPHRWRPLQQRSKQFDDIVYIMPYKMALGTWENEASKISSMCRVRCGKPCESHVSKALAKIQKIWRSNANKGEYPRQVCDSQRGSLSACWTEILMGLPIGWTDIDKSNEDLDEWPGWPAPMNANKNWGTPAARDGSGPSGLQNQKDLPKDVKMANSVTGQYPYEPPRVVEGQKNRAKRLKCLGNGCCPAQVYPIFEAIMEAEK